MDEYQIKNKIHELRSYIASNWPGVEERKHLYQRIAHLEKAFKDICESRKNDNKQDGQSCLEKK